MQSSSLRHLGFWSALLTAIFSSIFSISGFLALFKIISFPIDPIIPDGASLILAIAFVVMMVSIHHSVPIERSHWSHIGVVLATLYAALVSIVYFVIVTVVVPLTLHGEVNKVDPFVFDQTGSFMQAIDRLGYFL